jgi:ATP-dependent RNA helicase RhlE
MMENATPSKGKRLIRALILTPTRELAIQIGESIANYGKELPLRHRVIFGGVKQGRQVANLQKGVDILVATPGRLLDLIQQGFIRLDQIRYFVLDEADRMLDMGFIHDIKRIIKMLPAKRQSLLFSATMPRDIRKLADDMLDQPHIIELADSAPASTIDHGLYNIKESSKRDLLDQLLEAEECQTAIIFTRTKHRAKRLARQLENNGHRSVALQGNMSQAARDRAMKGFRNGEFDILVATDIAARGIDVEKVSHVINYDVPNTPQAYTHRIGRTGRSEAEGMAYTFVTGSDIGWLRATERMIGSPIERLQADGFAPDFSEADSTARHGRRRGNRSQRSGGRNRQGGGTRKHRRKTQNSRQANGRR